jgi:hypothetical protein
MVGWRVAKSKVCDLSESASRFRGQVQSNLKAVNLINKCGHGVLGNIPYIPSIRRVSSLEEPLTFAASEKYPC